MDPIAWRWRWKGGDEPDVWCYTESEPQGTRIVKEPLFASSETATIDSAQALQNEMDAARWRWFVTNANLGAFKQLDRSRWNEAVDASIEVRTSAERRG